jgi:hypothetical protein
MPNDNPIQPRLKTLFRFLTILIFCIVLWIALFGCHVDILQPQKLAQAKSSWDSKKIDHYEEVFTVGGFCGFPCFSEIKMEVKNNQIINATSRGSFLPNNDPFKPINQEQIVSGKLQNYTIDALFQRAESDLQQVGIFTLQTGNGRVYYVNYDPNLGFISRYDINDCGQGGLLSGGVSDCAWGVRVKSVDLLN